MYAQRSTRRAALIALIVAAALTLLALAGAFLLAVLVPEATDPAAWGTFPAVAWAAASLIGFFAASIAVLLADRLLSRIAGRPHTSHEAIILAVFTVIGAAVVSVWAFGIGIGLDPVPTWLNVVMTGAVAVTLFGVVVALALISDRWRRARARE